MIFFTADTHFGSERVLSHNFRPYKSVAAMDRGLIKNWNKTVKKTDTVYHIGDFGSYETVKKLNGNIILIFGNYEEHDLNTLYNNDFEAFKASLIKLGFKDAVEKGLELTLPKNNLNVYLTHKPLDCCKNTFNIFGHIHSRCLVKRFGVNAGVDNHLYCPINEDRIYYYKDAIENIFDNNIFCTENDLKN